MSRSQEDAGRRQGRRDPPSPDEAADPDDGGPGASSPGDRPGGHRTLLAGLAVSVAVHGVLVAVVSFPGPEGRDAADGTEAFRHVELPPRVEVPAAPREVPRPPEPRPRDVEVEESLGRSGSPVPAPPSGAAPTPPDVPPVPADERPALADADVPPIMEAPEELRERLRRRYPDRLRDLERGGVVELQFFVDARGDVARVEVRESSGHRRLDRTARRITREVTFLPAMVRDRTVGLWVRQRICFVFVEDPDERPTPEECERRVSLARE